MDETANEYTVIIQSRAERDIEEAFDYIYDKAPDAALKWYLGLKSNVESLANMPNRCPVAPESNKLGCELRQLIHGKRIGRYRIVFRIIESNRVVDIVTVRHGARKPMEIEDINGDWK